MPWYEDKPDWDVCWDFEGRKAKNSWSRSGYSSWSGEAWQEQQPWWPQNSWDEQAYMQAVLMQQQQFMQAASAGSASSSYAPPREDPLPAALPPSLEKRLSQLESYRAAPEPPDKDFEGSLKSLSERHGYGFIACEEIERIYGRDAYLPKELLPADVKVVFKVCLSKKGHPQVKEIRKTV
eukprot:TRINITY_DN17537_c0_g1_i1.p1 TRINITY_DN17537_c0_g1~~TRINITY_DN17537_c0_g1_i1.p1  ORF type:complete len:180 (-),score=37.79 TRINITY_DN17537_c0_g1_i1:118-657(-)